MSENTETLPPASLPPQAPPPAPPAPKPPEEGNQHPAPALGQDAPNKGTQGDGQQSEAGKPTTPQPPADVELKFAPGVAVDAELVGEFKKVAKDLGMNSTQAQKIADMYVGRQQAAQKSITDAWASTQDEWRKANRADSEIGGSKYDSNVEIARSAIQRLDPSGALRKEIEALGVGDNPQLLKAFVKIGKTISEDSIGRSGRPAPEADTENKLYDKLYPSMKKEA